MLTKKQTVLSAISIVACIGSASAEGTERLSPEREAWIATAFDRVLADPEQDPDRLSPQRIAMIHDAYDAWDAHDVDGLSPSRWAAMQSAYRTHEPDRIQFAGSFLK